MAAEAADQQNQENERKRVAREEEEILYRDANGDPLSLFKAMHQLVLNTLVPYRERALLAEGRLKRSYDAIGQALTEQRERNEVDFDEKYGKPNNRGGQNGFVISPACIVDVEVVWDNEAAIIRFGDRRIAPRIKEWLDWHREVLPAPMRRPLYHKKPIAGMGAVRTDDRVVIRVSDDRKEVVMKVDGFEDRGNETWVHGKVQNGKTGRFANSAIVSERRVLRYADPD
jgi:hypothetical protein